MDGNEKMSRGAGSRSAGKIGFFEMQEWERECLLGELLLNTCSTENLINKRILRFSYQI
jgi:hypothetical protein